MNENPKVSVIVPVFKAEKYLRRCVDSIIAQTFTDWECILVDDGSPDNSGVICDEYVKNDIRIHVIHKSNRGVSSARNSALDIITGEWLTFVDADDCLYPQMLERLLSQAVVNSLDLIQCHYNREYKEGQKEGLDSKVYSAFQYASEERCLTTVWGSLFKTKIIKEHFLRFDETIRLGEDQMFLLNYMQYSFRNQRICDVLYFYRNNEASAVNNLRPEIEITSVEAVKKMKWNNPIASQCCDIMMLRSFLSLTQSLNTPVRVIRELFDDVTFDYLSPSADNMRKLAFYLKRVNLSFSIYVLRSIYKIKYLLQKFRYLEID